MNPEELKKMTIPDLKAMLKDEGKPVSGNRATLVARLETPVEELSTEELKKLKLPRLKAMLKAEGKPVSGNKAQLVARLETPLEELKEAREAAHAHGAEKAKATREAVSPYRKQFEKMSTQELRQELRNRDLKESGTRAELIRRLAYNQAGLPEPKTPVKAKATQSPKRVSSPNQGKTVSPRSSRSSSRPSIPMVRSPTTQVMTSARSSRSSRGSMSPRSSRATSPRSSRATSPYSPPRTMEDFEKNLIHHLEHIGKKNIKKELEKRGLSTSGTMQVLEARLANAEAQE